MGCRPGLGGRQQLEEPVASGCPGQSGCRWFPGLVQWMGAGQARVHVLIPCPLCACWMEVHVCRYLTQMGSRWRRGGELRVVLVLEYLVGAGVPELMDDYKLKPGRYSYGYLVAVQTGPHLELMRDGWRCTGKHGSSCMC